MPKQTFFNLPPEKQARFLEIAIAEFAANDYQNASISRIVAQAGIAKGSFYQYFENKAELYRYLLDLGGQEKAALFQATPPAPDQSIFAYLRQLFQAGVAFELSQPQLSQIGYRAVKSDALPEDFLVEARAGGRAFFANLVAEGQRQGSIDPTLDTDLAAFVFNTIFLELGRYLLARFGEEEEDNGRFPHATASEPLFAQVLQILEKGFSPPDPKGFGNP
jgi:TetR/AcrR family transcriptional regulator